MTTLYTIHIVLAIGFLIAAALVAFRRKITPEAMMIVWWTDRAPMQIATAGLFVCIAGAAAYVLGQTTPAPKPRNILVSAATQFTYTGKVISVYDGDTITADLTTWVDPFTSLTLHGQRCRLLGIDTPELEAPTKAKGEAARDYLRRRLAAYDNAVMVETPGGTFRCFDNFGRRLVYLWLHEPDGPVRVNDELVSKGFAREFKQ